MFVPAKEGGLLFGLVSHVEIGSYEPQRRAVALNKTQDQLQREMPHVMRGCGYVTNVPLDMGTPGAGSSDQTAEPVGCCCQAGV